MTVQLLIFAAAALPLHCAAALSCCLHGHSKDEHVWVSAKQDPPDTSDPNANWKWTDMQTGTPSPVESSLWGKDYPAFENGTAAHCAEMHKDATLKNIPCDDKKGALCQWPFHNRTEAEICCTRTTTSAPTTTTSTTTVTTTTSTTTTTATTVSTQNTTTFGTGNATTPSTLNTTAFSPNNTATNSTKNSTDATTLFTQLATGTETMYTGTQSCGGDICRCISAKHSISNGLCTGPLRGNPVTHGNADSECAAAGGTLAVLHPMSLYDLTHQLYFAEKDAHFWLSGTQRPNATHYQDGFHWTFGNGSEMDIPAGDNRWQSGEPANDTDPQCVTLDRDQTSLNTKDCNSKKEPLCQWPTHGRQESDFCCPTTTTLSTTTSTTTTASTTTTTSSTTTTVSVSSTTTTTVTEPAVNGTHECLSGPHFDACGFCLSVDLTPDELTFTAAKGACERIGGELAILPCLSAAELQALSNFRVTSTANGKALWLNLHQTSTAGSPADYWAWRLPNSTDCAASNLPWIDGDPNDDGSSNGFEDGEQQHACMAHDQPGFHDDKDDVGMVKRALCSFPVSDAAYSFDCPVPGTVPTPTVSTTTTTTVSISSTTTTTVTEPANGTHRCLSGSSYQACGFCLTVELTAGEKTFDQAVDACEALGGALAILPCLDAAGLEDLDTFRDSCFNGFESSASGEDLWVNLRQTATTGNAADYWVWRLPNGTDCAAQNLPWNGGEPNDSDDEETGDQQNAAITHDVGRYQDSQASGTNKKRALCMFPISDAAYSFECPAPGPAPTPTYIPTTPKAPTTEHTTSTEAPPKASSDLSTTDELAPSSSTQSSKSYTSVGLETTTSDVLESQAQTESLHPSSSFPTSTGLPKTNSETTTATTTGKETLLTTTETAKRIVATSTSSHLPRRSSPSSSKLPPTTTRVRDVTDQPTDAIKPSTIRTEAHLATTVEENDKTSLFTNSPKHIPSTSANVLNPDSAGTSKARDSTETETKSFIATSVVTQKEISKFTPAVGPKIVTPETSVQAETATVSNQVTTIREFSANIEVSSNGEFSTKVGAATMQSGLLLSTNLAPKTTEPNDETINLTVTSTKSTKTPTEMPTPNAIESDTGTQSTKNSMVGGSSVSEQEMTSLNANQGSGTTIGANMLTTSPEKALEIPPITVSSQRSSNVASPMNEQTGDTSLPEENLHNTSPGEPNLATDDSGGPITGNPANSVPSDVLTTRVEIVVSNQLNWMTTTQSKDQDSNVSGSDGMDSEYEGTKPINAESETHFPPTASDEKTAKIIVTDPTKKTEPINLNAAEDFNSTQKTSSDKAQPTLSLEFFEDESKASTKSQAGNEHSTDTAQTPDTAEPETWNPSEVSSKIRSNVTPKERKDKPSNTRPTEESAGNNSGAPANVIPSEQPQYVSQAAGNIQSASGDNFASQWTLEPGNASNESSRLFTAPTGISYQKQDGSVTMANAKAKDQKVKNKDEKGKYSESPETHSTVLPKTKDGKKAGDERSGNDSSSKPESQDGNGTGNGKNENQEKQDDKKPRDEPTKNDKNENQGTKDDKRTEDESTGNENNPQSNRSKKPARETTTKRNLNKSDKYSAADQVTTAVSRPAETLLSGQSKSPKSVNGKDDKQQNTTNINRAPVNIQTPSISSGNEATVTFAWSDNVQSVANELSLLGSLDPNHETLPEEILQAALAGNSLPYIEWLEERDIHPTNNQYRRAMAAGEIYEFPDQLRGAIQDWFARTLPKGALDLLADFANRTVPKDVIDAVEKDKVGGYLDWLEENGIEPEPGAFLRLQKDGPKRNLSEKFLDAVEDWYEQFGHNFTTSPAPTSTATYPRTLKPGETTTPPYPLTKGEKMATSILQSLGCAALIGILAATIVLYTFVIRDFSIERCIHLNQELALLLAHLLVLFARDRTDIHVPCKLIALSLQSLFLSVFSFMTIEAFHAYSIGGSVIGKGGLMNRKQLTVLGWALPAVYAGSSALFLHDHYTSAWSCWLNLGHGVALATAVPALFLSGATIVLVEAAGMEADYPKHANYDPHQASASMFFLLYWTGAKQSQIERSAKAYETGMLPLCQAGRVWKITCLICEFKQRWACANQKGLLFVLPANIGSWLMGLYAVYEANVALYGIVAALNLTLALAIFSFHTLGNPKVHAWFKKISPC